MSRRMGWTILAILAAAVLVWAAAVGGMYFMRHALIYPFRYLPESAGRVDLDLGQTVRVEGGDGTPLRLWTVPARDGRPTILHFTGNGEALGSGAERMAELAEAGFGVVVMNYRGAAGAPGRPREAAIVADAVAVHDALPALLPGARATAPPVIHGTSLGAAVAVQLATRRPAAALVLEAPFARLCEVAAHHYPFLPACRILPDERWESLAAIDAVAAPILILHGAEDAVIPPAQSARLAAAAPEPKRRRVLAGAGHNDLHLHGAGRLVARFLAGIAPASEE